MLSLTLSFVKRLLPHQDRAPRALSDFFSLSLALAFFSGDYAYNINSFPKFLSLYKSTLNLSLYNLNLSNISME
jgi:hypothetical protein